MVGHRQLTALVNRRFGFCFASGSGYERYIYVGKNFVRSKFHFPHVLSGVIEPDIFVNNFVCNCSATKTLRERLGGNKAQ